MEMEGGCLTAPPHHHHPHPLPTPLPSSSIDPSLSVLQGDLVHMTHVTIFKHGVIGSAHKHETPTLQPHPGERSGESDGSGLRKTSSA